jgi:hypothetical protein
MRNIKRLVKDKKNEDLIINCDTCVAKNSSVCEECVVTFICNREPGEALVIDLEEERALRLLNKSGLVPPLRHLEVKVDI